MRRLKQISVTNLFGMFDHTIPLSLDERITIIHGPNGFGKTFILALLNELFSERNSLFRTTPFNEFRVEFDDGTSFWVTRTEINSSKRKGESTHPKITFHAIIKGVSQEPYTLRTVNPAEKHALRVTSLSSLNRYLPEVDYLDREHWKILATGEILSWEDLIDRFSDRLPLLSQSAPERIVPDWVKNIRSSLPIGFIQTQRLLNTNTFRSRDPEPDRHPVMMPTVIKYSGEIANLIKAILVGYSTLAQSLDRTFPARVVNPISRHELTVEELQNKLDELEKKRLRLTNAGLLDQDDSDFQIYREIDERTAFMLSVYVEDVEQKLGVFDKIVNKIELLTKIINKRFLFKRMVINKEQGFVIITKDGTTLAIEKLSSGEQHELVLFYELLFKVEPDSLILIDEPELSLHVAWQLEFLSDLQDITQLADLDILIATHSPQIINERWDLTVKLEGPRQ